ncbi:MAG: nucleotidyltransferase family protein [bacterium]|nr:nucleotidyltransferase family protein [bacterium]
MRCGLRRPPPGQGPRRIGVSKLRVLDPDAMLLLLVHHMRGHLAGSGYQLRWLIDLVYVLRHWGGRIDPERLGSLRPEPRDLALLGRILGLLSRELGVVPPPALVPLSGRVPPLGLSEVLRQRRLAIWGLPGPKGWARLIARVLGQRPRKSPPRPLPGFSDLLEWPRDLLRERRALSAVDASHRAAPCAEGGGESGRK